MIRKLLMILVALGLSVEAAVAANCTAYPLPYNLTNGQTADASQVMADLNNIVNCVNGLSAVTGPASSVTGHLATFADGTGKVVQDGGPFSVSAQYLANSAIAFGVNMLNGTIVPSNASNALTFTIQTLAGATPSAADPVYFLFRNANAGTGSYSVISVTSALSVTIPTSSTMGFSNNTPGRIWLTAINNAGTVELAVINCLTSTATSKSVFPLAGWGIITTTALGGPSNNGGVFYSTIARSSVPYGVLGYATYEAGLATAGTWNSNPSRLELFRSGVPLPGATLQTIYSTTTTTTNVSSTTKVATALVGTITPTSAVSLIKVKANGTLGSNSSTGSSAYASLWRNTGTTQIGNVAPCNTAVGGGSVSSLVELFALDNPQSTSSVQYGVYIANAGGGSVYSFLSTVGAPPNTGVIIIEEVMD
jgi:hypothetical protein